MAEKKKKSNVADEAFKKKVTIINGCILLAFIIALGAFLVYTWQKEDSYPERFAAEVEAARQAATVTDSDKSVIDIDVTDETFVDWILELDHSYQHKDGEHYKSFDGNTIHLEGVFEEVEINKNLKEYWVYRKYIDVDGGENMVPIRVIFEGDAPENGAWVDVVGIVSSEYGISCIKEAKVTVLDSSEKREIVK